jgi:sec-independent protein translocase protein TatC
MTFLEHLEELRSRLFRSAIAFVAAMAICWGFSGQLLAFLLRPIREKLFGGGEIVFIELTEPFFVYMKASALAAVFLASPYLLWQLWGFVAPGLYKKERRMAAGFIVFGTTFFVLGGAFGYLVATPVAANWLIQLGGDFTAQLTLRSAFAFESRVILGMGAVFELPIVIFFLARIGVVTPGFLMKHFRLAVVIIAIIAAVVTPTGDALTMGVFAVPMVLLYLLGVAVAWGFARDRRPARGEGDER